MSRVIRGRYRNTKRNRYRTTPYKWDFRNRSWDVGRRPIKGPDRMTLLGAGAGATFTTDTASADGWTFDTANDTLWIGDTTTGIKIIDNGGTTAGFKLQTIEFDPGILLRVTGPATCTRFRCPDSTTDIAGELDVSNLKFLTYLNCYNNSITTLDISNLTSLIYLQCYNNSISVLDVSALTSLVTLYCHNNPITTLNISALTSLIILYMYNTNILSVSAGEFDNLDALAKVYWYDCSLVTAVVDLCVMDFHGDRVAKTAMEELKLAGNNEAVTGTYQAPAVPGSPANAAEAAHELVNVEGWTVEINTV